MILPLSSDSPIYVIWPDFDGEASVVSLDSIEVVQIFDAWLTAA